MSALYTVQAEHRHKPGRRFYLDRDLCLATDAKTAKALPWWRAWAALALLRALAWLLADGAPGMTPKVVELAFDDAAGA